jgi:nickel transport protein
MAATESKDLFQEKMEFHDDKRRLLLRNTLFLLYIFLSIPVGVPETAHAHKVVVFGYADNGMLKTESAFSGGAPVQNGKISIYGMPRGKLIISGVTGNNGKWEVPLSKIPDGLEGLKVVLDAGGGHSARWFMEPADYGRGNSGTTRQESIQPEKNPRLTKKNRDGKISAHYPDMRELEEVIARAVRRETAPLKRIMLENLSKGPDLREIVGAAGYLIGIAGIIAYFKSRKQENTRRKQR